MISQCFSMIFLSMAEPTNRGLCKCQDQDRTKRGPWTRTPQIPGPRPNQYQDRDPASRGPRQKRSHEGAPPAWQRSQKISTRTGKIPASRVREREKDTERERERERRKDMYREEEKEKENAKEKDNDNGQVQEQELEHEQEKKKGEG